MATRQKRNGSTAQGCSTATEYRGKALSTVVEARYLPPHGDYGRNRPWEIGLGQRPRLISRGRYTPITPVRAVDILYTKYRQAYNKEYMSI